jgi:hypothetical protein
MRHSLLTSAFLLAVVVAPRAIALSCDGRLIEIDNRSERVAMLCGAPDYREEWEEQWIQIPVPGLEREAAVASAEWIYDFGPERLMRVLLFYDGVLKRMETRGYGGRHRAGRCTERVAGVGDTKLEVLYKCGEPGSVERFVEYRTEPVDPVHRRRFPVVTERWVYISRGDSLGRVVVFRQRRVVAVESQRDAR